jgi:hypothetical protein
MGDLTPARNERHCPRDIAGINVLLNGSMNFGKTLN